MIQMCFRKNARLHLVFIYFTERNLDHREFISGLSCRVDTELQPCNTHKSVGFVSFEQILRILLSRITSGGGVLHGVFLKGRVVQNLSFKPTAEFETAAGPIVFVDFH
jgi:hypothetical protein